MENLCLSIDENTPINAVFEALSLTENSARLLPNLQTLSFDHPYPSELSPLLNLIASRDSGLPARELVFEGLLPLSSLDCLSGSSSVKNPLKMNIYSIPCVPVRNILFAYKFDSCGDDLEHMDQLRGWHRAEYG